MDSWTSNYIARLEELQGLLEKDIAEIKLPDLVRDGRDFLEETDCSREEIELLCAAVADAREKARNAILCLLGGAPERAAQSVDDIEAFSGIVNRLSAIRQQIFNVLDQARDDKNSVWNKHAAEIKDAFKGWGALALLPKLNQMSGGVPHAQEKLEEEQRRFAAVQKAQGEHYEALMRWAQEAGDAGDVLQALCERERERAQKRRSGAVNCRELALRWVLQRLASTVRGRDDEAAEAVRGWFLRQRIFAEVKDFNKFFQNHLGRIYVSPYSNGRHQAYALTPGTVERGSEIWQSLLDLLRDQDESNGLAGEAAETRLRLRSLVMGMRISALKTLIPSRVAALHLEDEIAQEVVPEGLRLLLEQPGVAPSVMAKAFNLYQSLLSGTLIVLRRERFYLRTKFMWVGNNTLVYVPKSKEWNMPERYRKSKAWEEVFNLGVLEFTSSGAVDVGKTFVRALECLDKECIRELLHQLPHDWCYELPLQKASRRKSGENWVDALLVEKKGASGTVLVKYKSSRTLLARLVGPSTQKERLNELLLNPRVVVGDMTLLADQEVEQKFCADGLELALGRLEISIAAPITQPPVSAAAQTPPFKRIVSIDQGEAGLGFAVFDLGEAGNAAAQPIACGLVSIPSLKRLIKGVRGYRRKGQSRQKFNQRFDSTMFTLRENAAGDVCGAIAGLMSRYSALPVLERDVSNLASGGKQLELVYKMVNARFVADQTQAHRLEREAWWYGAGAWSLPDLWQEVSLEYAARIGKDAARKTLRKENEKFYKKLTVYPGAAVRAHWTSRICSHCGGNISELVQRAKESGIKKVALNGNGEATLFGRTVRLYREPDAETKRKARRRNERADWTKPMGEGELSLEDFHKAARKNLRRPPKSLREKDGMRVQKMDLIDRPC